MVSEIPSTSQATPGSDGTAWRLPQGLRLPLRQARCHAAHQAGGWHRSRCRHHCALEHPEGQLQSVAEPQEEPAAVPEAHSIASHYISPVTMERFRVSHHSRHRRFRHRQVLQAHRPDQRQLQAVGCRTEARPDGGEAGRARIGSNRKGFGISVRCRSLPGVGTFLGDLIALLRTRSP